MQLTGGQDSLQHEAADRQVRWCTEVFWGASGAPQREGVLRGASGWVSAKIASFLVIFRPYPHCDGRRSVHRAPFESNQAPLDASRLPAHRCALVWLPNAGPVLTSLLVITGRARSARAAGAVSVGWCTEGYGGSELSHFPSKGDWALWVSWSGFDFALTGRSEPSAVSAEKGGSGGGWARLPAGTIATRPLTR